MPPTETSLRDERAKSTLVEVQEILDGRNQGQRTESDIRRKVGARYLVAAFGAVIAVLCCLGMRLWVVQGERETMTVETTAGIFKICLYPKISPQAVARFRHLASTGFYDDMLWHRVDDWIIQTGDGARCGRTEDNATVLPLEVSPKLLNRRGSVAMARSAGFDTATTQFYILKADAPWLDSKYAVFGKVISGMEIVDSVKFGDKVIRVWSDFSGR